MYSLVQWFSDQRISQIISNTLPCKEENMFFKWGYKPFSLYWKTSITCKKRECAGIIYNCRNNCNRCRKNFKKWRKKWILEEFKASSYLLWASCAGNFIHFAWISCTFNIRKFPTHSPYIMIGFLNESVQLSFSLTEGRRVRPISSQGFYIDNTGIH